VTRLRRALFAGALAALAPAAGAATRAECPKQPFDAPAAGAAETAEARAARRDLEMVVNVLAGYRTCESELPEFVQRFGPDYQSWRRKYGEALRRYERNGRARRYVECGVEEERKRAAASDADGKMQKAQLCNAVIGPGIRRLVQDDPPR
jgi:hypothetical protein